MITGDLKRVRYFAKRVCNPASKQDMAGDEMPLMKDGTAEEVHTLQMRMK